LLDCGRFALLVCGRFANVIIDHPPIHKAMNALDMQQITSVRRSVLVPSPLT
jgi:hypothetical protein